MQLSKLFYFLKYFLYCAILSNFFKSAKKKQRLKYNFIVFFSDKKLNSVENGNQHESVKSEYKSEFLL
jgi:hypothetical protein